ncbi:efflux RND transporter permease subunit [Herminiimonas sp. CN]|uniref:efflux RND transporter permease subunit n=1 Tax=Herminiimonas sp. CN TaxID=1349818 RepID=UPI0004733D58|nr:efflux RND transporter permease subunit [Herminiimonas sp. CN]
MGIAGRLSKFFLHSQLTPLIALVAILLGLFAVLVTPREEEPQINVTMANVLIPFPGASAKDVETLVATPAEQVISQIQGLDHVFSVSKPGMAIVTVQFKVGVPRTEALVRLYDTIHSNRDWLPRELNVGEPLVKPKGIDDVPVLSLTLWTKDLERGAYELERVAHAMEIELKRVPGTREVGTIGGPGRLVRVLLDIDKLNAYHLAVGDIRQALLGVNVTLPAGQLIADNATLEVQTGNFLANAKEIGELIVGVSAGNPVTLSDVARVVDGPAQPSKYVWFGVGKAAATDGLKTGSEFPAVTITITKKPGENAVQVAQQLTQRVAELRNTVIPAGVEVNVTRNYGETANDKAMKLIQKLIFATTAVVVLVFFLLGRREAAIVGIAVILTLAATLFASWAWGFTLNRVSLFALIFSIGILVDDAIVVVENIHRHRELHPDQPLLDIIPLAVDEVGGPTILATFTVIAALLPMAFVTGLMGPYMSPIPINASMGMVISLAIAFTVTPWLAHRLSGKHVAAAAHGSAADSKLQRWFGALLLPFLAAKKAGRNRRLLWVGVLLAILISVSLAAVQLVVLKMLPFDNKSEFQVVVDLPAGTPVENTAAVLHQMSAYLSTVSEVTDVQAYAGTAAPINFNGLVRQYYLRQSPELGDLQVNLTDKHQRSRKSHDIAGAVRAPLEQIAARNGAKVKVVEVPPGPPVLSPLVAEIYGPDEAGRHALAKQVRQAFGQTADIIGIDDSIEDNAPKVVLQVDQRKAALLGIAATDVVQTVRVGLDGEDITVLHDGQSKYSIPVRLNLPPEKQARLATLLAMTVKSANGDNVPLSELVKVQPTAREKTIYHKDLLPVTYVIGDMAGKLDSPLYGMFAVRGKLGDLSAAQGAPLGEYFIRQPSDPYRQFALKWDGEWQITYETFRDMGLAYAVGLVLVYILVVAQFGSYLTPLIIMAPIPLTIIGVMPGHALLGAQYTATSMIGMIALAGIIVRNSILLVDFINLQVAQGVAFVDATVHATAARAKPIVLTGLAAIIGALFILDDPIFNGLAISLIFGIFVSTLLTLVVIPVLYYAANRKKFS